MKYKIREDSGASKIIDADSIEEALEQAREWAADGSYDERVMVTVYVHELDPETEEPYDGWYYGDGRPPETRLFKERCPHERLVRVAYDAGAASHRDRSVR